MEAMASLTAGSIGDLVEKLQLLADQCSRIVGVRKQVAFLRDELAAMHAMLLKVESMEDGGAVDVQVKAWARDVRETSYDVEDCVDAFTNSLRLARAGGGEQGQGVRGRIVTFFRMCAQFLLTIRISHNFAAKISELKARVVEVGERRERYNFDIVAGSHSGSPALDPRLPALFAEDADFVGIAEPTEELESWLQSKGQALGIVAIAGFGGMGKTTLARRLYERIIGQYPCSSAFVSVSQKPDLKEVLARCAVQLLREPDDAVRSLDGLEILKRIRGYLSNRRFVIVIDDIWSTDEAWDTLKFAFPVNECGSRLIITTRNLRVAESCVLHMDGLVYHMQPLDINHSKRLFLKKCEDLFEDVVNDILEKCGGLPLAIICISGVLASKNAVKEEWIKVRDSISSQIEKRLNVILMMSYNDLPRHLKVCLLYLSTFPEDYAINRERLVNKWVAEGFVRGERGLRVHDVAEGYFDELINRSLIQPEGIGFNGKATACKLHDLLLELIISLASEENFVTIIGQPASGMSDGQLHIRRVSFQYANSEKASCLKGFDLSHVRSITTFGSLSYIPALAQFQALRIIDFEFCTNVEQYNWNNVEILNNVTFLSLRNSLLSMVPLGVTKLLELRTLDLRGTGISHLPDSIEHLTKLERLLIGDYGHGETRIPKRIDKMTNLEVLTFFDVIHSSEVSVENLGKLTNLRDLGIQFDGRGFDGIRSHEAVLVSVLSILGNLKLRSLWIASIDRTSLEFLNAWAPLPLSLQSFRMSTKFYFLGMPTWISPALTNLAYLNINLDEVKESDLEILGSLQALLSLELWFKTEQRYRLVLHAGGFKSLKRFIYVRGPEILRGAGYLVFESEALQKLEYLEMPFFVSMAKNYNFYLGIKHLRCLKAAKITLYIRDATSDEIMAAEAAVINEATAHPGHPRIRTLRGQP